MSFHIPIVFSLFTSNSPSITRFLSLYSLNQVSLSTIAVKLFSLFSHSIFSLHILPVLPLFTFSLHFHSFLSPLSIFFQLFTFSLYFLSTYSQFALYLTQNFISILFRFTFSLYILTLLSFSTSWLNLFSHRFLLYFLFGFTIDFSLFSLLSFSTSPLFFLSYFLTILPFSTSAPLFFLLYFLSTRSRLSSSTFSLHCLTLLSLFYLPSISYYIFLQPLPQLSLSIFAIEFFFFFFFSPYFFLLFSRAYVLSIGPKLGRLKTMWVRLTTSKKNK